MRPVLLLLAVVSSLMASPVIGQTYESEVDEAGTVRTPYGDFEDVLRVNTSIERHAGVGVLPARARVHTFVAECFTSIAVVTSAEGEAAADFERVAEVRRLAPLPGN